MALLAVASLVGALLYGAHTWRAQTSTRYLVLAAALALGLAPSAAATSVPVLAILIMVGGLALGPLTAVVFALLDDIAPRSAMTEATTWVVTAFSFGVAIGSAMAGVARDAGGVRAALLVAPAGALLQALVILARRDSLVGQR